MQQKVELTDVFLCSLDLAFKTPILGDATQFLNGYLFQAPVVGFEDDETWGEVGGVRYPVTNGNLFMAKGRIFTDKVISRNENKSWSWMVYDFKLAGMFFAEKAIGEWEVKELGENKIQVKYCYTFYSKNKFYHLFTMMFALVQWKGMMRKALMSMKRLAESNAPLVYPKSSRK